MRVPERVETSGIEFVGDETLTLTKDVVAKDKQAINISGFRIWKIQRF